MKKCTYSAAREEILANAISPVAAELRLLDAADLISMLRYEYHANLADLIESAAELYFHPGTITFGIGGDYRLEWDGYPAVTLDLEIKPQGLTIYARLTLEAETASIDINYIRFNTPSDDPDANTAFLAQSLKDAAFARKMPTLAAPAASHSIQ